MFYLQNFLSTYDFPVVYLQNFFEQEYNTFTVKISFKLKISILKHRQRS